MQRFYVLLDGEVTLEKTQDSVRRHMAPHAVEFTHIEWFSKFESRLCFSDRDYVKLELKYVQSKSV